MVDLNHLLRSAQSGDPHATTELAALLYDELRTLARREMASERTGHTLQPTALVNEAYLRLMGGAGATFADRDSFFAAAATTIRRVLVDHARRRAREKRGGAHVRVPLEGLEISEPFEDHELLALDAALAELARIDATKARIVELRYFAGRSLVEVAASIGVSESTVQREWRLARAWLRARLEDDRGR